MSDTTETPAARPFQFTGRIRSFYHAIRGVLRMIRCQHNAWIHAAATLVVIVAGLFFSRIVCRLVLDHPRHFHRLDG